MYRSTSEYVSCCKETFQLFLFVDHCLKAAGAQCSCGVSDAGNKDCEREQEDKCNTLSPIAAECAFATLTGYRMQRRKNDVSSVPYSLTMLFSKIGEKKDKGITEEEFLDRMKECALRDAQLVASEKCPSWTVENADGDPALSPFVSPACSSHRLHSSTAWSMYLALANHNGFITLDELQRAEKPKGIYDGLLDEGTLERKLCEAVYLFGKQNSVVEPSGRQNVSYFWGEMAYPDFSIAEHLYNRLNRSGNGKIGFSAFKSALS